MLGVFLNHFPVYDFEAESLSSLDLPIQIDLLASEFLRSVCLYFSGTGFTFVS